MTGVTLIGSPIVLLLAALLSSRRTVWPHGTDTGHLFESRRKNSAVVHVSVRGVFTADLELPDSVAGGVQPR